MCFVRYVISIIYLDLPSFHIEYTIHARLSTVKVLENNFLENSSNEWNIFGGRVECKDRENNG